MAEKTSDTRTNTSIQLQVIQGQIPSSQTLYERVTHSKCYIFTNLFAQILLSWTPIWDVVTDILTIILYYSNNDTYWATISLIIVLYSMRNQSIFYALTITKSASCFNPITWISEGNVFTNLMLLVPYFGVTINCGIIKPEFGNGDDGSLNRWDFLWPCCAFLCVGPLFEVFVFTLGAVIGVFVVLLMVFHKFLMNVLAIKKLCKGQIITKDDDIEAVLLILKCLEAFTESLPQLVLQAYVFMTTEVYSNRQELILFILSIIFSSISLIRIVYKIITQWWALIWAFEFTIDSLDHE